MQAEGPAFMFKGWLPAWSRLQPTTILIFVTLEQLKGLVDLGRAKGIAL
jgi:dicarboxylate transporter 10